MQKCPWNVLPREAMNTTFLIAPTTYYGPREVRFQIGAGHKNTFEEAESPAELRAKFDQPVEEITGVNVNGGNAWVQFQVFAAGGVDPFNLAYFQ